MSSTAPFSSMNTDSLGSLGLAAKATVSLREMGGLRMTEEILGEKMGLEKWVCEGD